VSVYYVRCSGTGLIKIGFSERPYDRFVKIQSDSPSELSLIATEAGGAVREAFIHKTFAEHRARGEWFRPSGELLKYIVSLGDVEARPRRTFGAPHVEGEIYSIDNLRHDNQWTLDELSAKLGVGKSYLCQMANGSTTISPRIALALEDLSHGRIYAGDLNPEVKMVDDHRAARITDAPEQALTA
jgi:DNA-binding transcriptional regulator YdaS (Cro superfamily)